MGKRHEVEIAILKALGIDTNNLKAATIDMEATSYTVVECKYVVLPLEVGDRSGLIDDLKYKMRRYELREIKEEDK